MSKLTVVDGYQLSTVQQGMLFDYLSAGRQGVDFEQIDRDSRSKYVSEEMERLSDELNLGGKLVGLGIDRIDYTKGIPHRFRAMGRFLEKYPQYQGKVVLVQAGVMSRIDIDA